jgi:predicted phage terminase large subunit-like protein
VDTARGDGLAVDQDLPQDPGQSGKSQKRALAKRLSGLSFSFSPETGSKEDRAIPFASQWNAGNVVLVKGPWNDAFLAELATFPRGQYKDQVDALSRAYARLLARPDFAPPEGGDVITVGAGSETDWDQEELDMERDRAARLRRDPEEVDENEVPDELYG